MDSCLRRVTKVAVCWEPKTILTVALALPNKRQYDPDILYLVYIIDARMNIIAKYGIS